MLWYFVVFIVVGLVAWRIIGEGIERDLSGLELAAYLFGLFGATIVMVLHMADPIGPAIALSIIAFALLHNTIGWLVNQSQLASMRALDMQDCEKAIQEHPDRAYPYLAMGDMLLQQGLVEDAVAYYKRAVSLKEEDLEAKQKLKQCEAVLRRRREKLIICPECLAEIPRDAKECPNCGHYMRLSLPLMSTWDWLRPVALAAGGVAAAGAVLIGGVILARVSPWLAPAPAVVVGGVAAWQWRAGRRVVEAE